MWLRWATAVSAFLDEEGRTAGCVLGYVGLFHTGSQGYVTAQVGTSERAGSSAQCVVGILWFIESSAGGASDYQMDSCGLVGSCFGIFV